MLKPFTERKFKKTVLTGKRARASLLVLNQVSRDSLSGSGLKVPCGVSETVKSLTPFHRANVYVLLADCIHSPSAHKHLLFKPGSLIMLLSPYLPEICLLAACVPVSGVHADHTERHFSLDGSSLALAPRCHRKASHCADFHEPSKCCDADSK